MKTISVSVSEEDYEAFRSVAASEGRPIALMIREAMAAYRVAVLGRKPSLRTLHVLAGHRAREPLPTREEVYEDVFRERP
jgi:hypothetical protein